MAESWQICPSLGNDKNSPIARPAPISGRDRNWHGLCIVAIDSGASRCHLRKAATMFKLDRIDLQRISVSAIGAVLLSAICIAGAIAPARVGVSAAQAVKTVN